MVKTNKYENDIMRPRKKITTVVVAGNFFVIGAFSQIDGPMHFRVTAARNK